jgi:hypothetical protein
MRKMNDLGEQLTRRARQQGLSLDAAKRLHLLQGVLRRWAQSCYAGALVLGGSLLTQLWVGAARRLPNDIDFTGLFSHHPDESAERFSAILRLEVDDGIELDLGSLRVETTWPESRFPGTRSRFLVRLLGEEHELSIDVGFGLPLVPPAREMDYPCLLGPILRITALRPELLLTWKLDGLFEHGRGSWLPKGLFDLDLLTRYVELNPDILEGAIRTSFEAKGIPVERVLDTIYSRAWWEKGACRNKWARFVTTAAYPVPANLIEVADAVARALRPVLERIIDFPPAPANG